MKATILILSVLFIGCVVSFILGYMLKTFLFYTEGTCANPEHEDNDLCEDTDK